MDMARKGPPHREGGPGKLLLGEYPKLATVNRVFILGLVSTYLIADIMPSDLRNYWLGLITGIEMYAAFYNHHYGLRFNFAF